MANSADFDATQKSVIAADTTSIADLFLRAALDTVPHVCDANDERKHYRRTKFTYTLEGGFMRTYPMLWVYFDEQARVNNVYAKEYAGDDFCIYSLSDNSSQRMYNEEAMNRLFDRREE
ncbi:hypothetical protein IC235_16400 [Hymenobacter sp. BT664]|uniref:Uncharacterized protein n=1 Tax=Hymenobacter montanus TaxID=2771359 RepID=A0A927BFH7_9BACT|nr:hypothetical protein [Hymenobacter montanus]MBD2769471.1 hypothetical protein [Hymenobacter montanus]